MELERRSPGQGYAREALAVSERALARSLLDLLQEAQADIREGVDPALRDRERRLLVRLNAKASQQADLLSRPATAERRRTAEGEVRSVLDELAQVEAEIRRSSPRYAALTRPPLAASSEIQGLLDGETLLLEYWLGEERSFLWAVDRDSVTGFELPPRERIETAAREVYGRLGVLAPGDDRFEPAAASLSRMLLGPVAGKLAEPPAAHRGRRRAAVHPFRSAAGSGRRSPTPARPARDRQRPFRLGRGSAETARPSGARAGRCGRAGRSGLRSRGSAPCAAQAGKEAAAGGGLRSSSFLRLPWSRREAEAIATVAANSPAGRPLLALDFRASRETALSPELSGYRIVHFATHGIIDSRTPALSG